MRSKFLEYRRKSLYTLLTAICFFGLIFLLCLFHLHLTVDFENTKEFQKTISKVTPNRCNITIVTAICGDSSNSNLLRSWSVVEKGNIDVQISQAFVTIKTIILMNRFYEKDDGGTNGCIEFIILSDSKSTFNKLQTLLYQNGLWRSAYRRQIYLTYKDVSYPSGFEDFHHLYRPCSTVKLFLHKMLPDLDSILYLDTDVLLLVNPQKIWSEFEKFSLHNWAAFAPDQYSYSTHHIFYYGKTGINSGVVLFNLTRMRESDFLNKVRTTATKFWRGIRGDQDIFNVYFHYNPKEIRELKCFQNFMYFSCQVEWMCDPGVEGIQVLHGAAHTFLPDREEPFLRGVYECFNKTTLHIETSTQLHRRLSKCVEHQKRIKNSTCSHFIETRDLIHMNH